MAVAGMNQTKSWLHQLLSAAVILAVSAWLIAWAVALLRPLLPVGIFLVVVVGLDVVVRGLIQRRRGW